MADTRYMVLRKDGAGAWAEVGVFDAPSGKAAIRLAAEDEGSGYEEGTSGELVPVPVRSWTPMKVAWEPTLSLRVTRSTVATGVENVVVGNGGTNG